MKFILDNNLPPAFAKALNALSRSGAPDVQEVIHLKDKFKENTPDIVWLETLEKEGGWVIITNDRLGKSSAEKIALRNTGLIVFILKSAWKNQKFWIQAEKIVKWFPSLVEQGKLVKSGVFEVPFRFSGKGKLTIIKP